MADTLYFGTINLNDGISIVIDNDSDFGVSVPLTETIERLLTDGQVVTGDRSGNRLISIPLDIRAATHAAAVAIEAQIAYQANQPYTALAWTPDGGTATVFDCFRGTLVREYSSITAGQGRIKATLTVPALPFARSQAPVTLAPSAVVADTLDSFDAASGSRTITITNSSGTNTQSFDTTTKIEGTAAFKLADALWTTGGSAVSIVTDITFSSKDLSTQASVVMGWLLGRPSNGDTAIFSVTNGGYTYTSRWTLTLRSSGGTATWIVDQNPPQAEYPSGYSWMSVVWPILQTPNSTTGTFSIAAVTSARVEWQFGGGNAPGSFFSAWRDYLRAVPANGLTVNAASGTARLDGIRGNARTPVDLLVTGNGATAFNRLLIASYPNPPGNFDPILAATATGTTASSTSDSTAIQGNYRTITGTDIARYQRQANTVNGTYTLVMRAKGTGVATTITASTHISGDSTGGLQTITRAFTSTELTNANYALYTIGQLVLPPRGVTSNSTATVNIDIGVTSGNFRLDQIYLVDAAGDSVLIDPGTSRSFSRWLLRAPDPSAQRGDVLAGTLADETDYLSVMPWVYGQPILNLQPGSNLVLVVADKVNAGSAVQVIYYPRYQIEALP